MDMRHQSHAVAKLDAWPDNAVRPDLDALTYARAVGYARGRIDHVFASPIIAPSSASATTVVPTRASVWYHHMKRRFADLRT